jgi:hypothetical protein
MVASRVAAIPYPACSRLRTMVRAVRAPIFANLHGFAIHVSSFENRPIWQHGSFDVIANTPANGRQEPATEKCVLHEASSYRVLAAA